MIERSFGSKAYSGGIYSSDDVIAALLVGTAVVGYLLYQERQKTTGIEINVGKGGISVETK